MNLQTYKSQLQKPLREYTLIFLLKKDHVLLGYKKRGFGKGLYNGVGGKLEPSETALQCALRETQEEIGVEASNLVLHSRTDCYWLQKPFDDAKYNQRVYIYSGESWQGDIVETSEIKPTWFNISSIPYHKMWPYLQIALPKILMGETFNAEFGQKGDDAQVAEYRILPFTNYK